LQLKTGDILLTRFAYTDQSGSKRRPVVLFNQFKEDLPVAYFTAEDDILSVEEIAGNVIKLWGKGKYKITPDRQFHESSLLNLDISKARSDIRWNPVYNAFTALEKTISRYKKYYANNKKGIYEDR
jgi:hypothetical protein